VRDASIRQDASPCCSASAASSGWISSSCPAPASTNFTALPPPDTNSRRYSRSMTSSHASAVTPISPSPARDKIDGLAGAFSDIALTDIFSRSRHEPDAVIDPLGSLFVVDDQRLDALCGGPAGEIETLSAACAEIRLAVQKQEVAGEFLLRIVGARQQRKGVVNFIQRDHPARIGPVPLAPDKPPIGAPDDVEKCRLPETLWRFLRLHQESDELARPNPALDLPADAHGGLVCVDAQKQRKAIDASVPFEHLQSLFGGRRLEVREKAAVGHIGRPIETPCAGKVARRRLGVCKPIVECAQAPGNVAHVSDPCSAAHPLKPADQSLCRLLRLFQPRIERDQLIFE